MSLTSTQPTVVVSSSALPTGASTAALQTQPGVDIGDVTVNNAGGGSAVNIQDGGNTITVDGAVTVTGSVTANAGTNLNTSTLALESGGNLASVNTNTDPLVTSGGGGYVRQDSTATIAKETGGNLATIVTDLTPFVTSGGGGYVRQDSTATIAKESGGNLATVASVVDTKGVVELIGSPTVTYASANGTPIGTATTTDVVSAPTSGHHLEIWHLHASNAGATSCKVGWKEASGTQLYETQLPQNGVVSKNLYGDWHLTTATKLQLVTDAAGSIYWTVGSRTVVD